MKDSPGPKHLSGIWSLLGLRSGERREALVAVAVIGSFVAGHAALETARDALFLSGLDAERLPWAYLAIALSALLLTALSRAWMPGRSHRRLLFATLLIGAAATASWWLLASVDSAVAVFGLYVWTGLLATVVVIRFWIHLAASFDVDQARRSFTVIGAGGLAGAAAGAFLARLLLSSRPPRDLLLLAAALFVVAALFATKLRNVRPSTREESRPPESAEDRDGYIWRLFLVVGAITVLVTVGDYAFKATVAAALPGEELGPFFASYHTVTNLLALSFQLSIAPRLLQRAGVNVTLAVMPLLLLGLALGFAAVPGLLAIVAFKGANDILRHSLHRSSTEILFLPLSDHAREQAKSFVETMGMRGGQAAASLALLAAFSLGADRSFVAWMLVGAGVIAVVSLVGVKGRYVARFRARLADGRMGARESIGDLDLHSLEALVGALSASDEQQVVAALDLLHAYGRTPLVPALILYHPSDAVVLHALEQFRRTGRADIGDAIRRLLDHRNPDVRAAATSYEHTGGLSIEQLRARLADPSPKVRSTALVLLAARQKTETSDALLRELLDGNADDHHALALALGRLGEERIRWLSPELARRADESLAATLATTLAEEPSPAALVALIRLLAHRSARDRARDALVALGDDGLTALSDALDDPELPRGIRRHLPRSISRFPQPDAMDVLIRRLGREPNPQVEFKILRALGRMRADRPDFPIDERGIVREVMTAVHQAAELLRDALVLARLRDARPHLGGPALPLLLALVREAHDASLERAFRLLHILQPDQDYEVIYDGLHSDRAEDRAAAREILRHAVPDAVVDVLMTLTDDANDLDRVRLLIESGGVGTRRSLLPEAHSQSPVLDAMKCLLGMLHLADRNVRSFAAEVSVDLVQRLQPQRSRTPATSPAAQEATP